jgi:hypothetical protein
MGLRSWRGRFAWLVGGLSAVLLAGWMLARMTPAWYDPLDPNDLGVMQAANVAQTRAGNLWNAFERVPLGEQRWTISQDEVNAFLAVNPALTPADTAAATEGNRLPISDPCVIFQKGKITICARALKLPSGDPQGGVGSLTFSVGIVDGDGGKPMGQVKLTHAWVGNLPVPASVVQGRISALLPNLRQAARRGVELQRGTQEVQKVGTILDDLVDSLGNGRPFPLQYKIEKKEFLIKELSVDNGAFTVVLAPVKPPASTSARPSASTGATAPARATNRP